MEYEIKPHEKLNLGLKELWHYRELFFFFTWRDVKVKYKQTLLGFTWAILQPLIYMLLFSFFGKAFHITTDGNMDYRLFSYSGVILWLVFSSGLTNAGNSMVTNANIIKKIYFPRLIIPISAILVSLFDFLMSFIIFIPMLFYYHASLNLSFIAFLPLSLFITAFSTFGIGTLLAAMNIKYRDFRYVIPFMVQAGMFVTPVMYNPVTATTKLWVQYVFALNPMYSAIELFRAGFSNVQLRPDLIGISLFSTILFFLVGLYYFRRTEAYFADVA
jgi:lipopolysaccharide transport system permease protein